MTVLIDGDALEWLIRIDEHHRRANRPVRPCEACNLALANHAWIIIGQGADVVECSTDLSRRPSTIIADKGK